MAPRPIIRRPAIRRGPAVLLLLTFQGIALAQGIALVASGPPDSSQLGPIVWTTTGAFGVWLGFPFVQLAVVNALAPHSGWGRRVAMHVAGYVLFATVCIATKLGLRFVAGSLFGPGMSPHESIEAAVWWEAQSDLVIYMAMAALWSFVHASSERRKAETRAASLEAALGRTRLEALSAKLEPHFLFNALNTVAALMYEDLPRTERLLAGLGDLLRASLQAGQATWKLGDEREHTRKYVELAEARFGDRLRFRWHERPGVAEVQVPRFCIQGLVENSIKHNADRLGVLSIEAEASRASGRLLIVVEDDGLGFQESGREGRSRGVARLEETLRILYGSQATLELARGAGGGARVTVVIPGEALEAA